MGKLINTPTLSILLLIVFFICLSTEGNCQARESTDEFRQKSRKKGSFDPDRMRYGGSFGATFGDITYVDVAPTVGYMLTDNLLYGISGRYIYYEEKFLSYKFSTNIYGGGTFVEYFILDNFTLHAEYELLNMVDRFQTDQRINVSSVLVGGGYRMMVGRNSFVSILLLFNLNETENSIYSNPIVRINFGIGL